MYGIEPIFSKLAFFSATAYLAIAGILWIRNRHQKIRLVGVSLGVVAVIGILFTLNPFSGTASFGPSPILLVTLMFFAICFGVVAECITNTTSEFSWIEMIRPTLLAPILLMPLVGLLSDSQNYSTEQTISVLLVSFQNGFFWREILKRAKNAL